ncbi:hypothetical protein ACFX2I_029486 [Malus domestica]
MWDFENEARSVCFLEKKVLDRRWICTDGEMEVNGLCEAQLFTHLSLHRCFANGLCEAQCFEISCDIIADVQSRKQIVTNAKLLVDWTRGRNLIISSAALAPTANEFTGSYDVANLGLIWMCL